MSVPASPKVVQVFLLLLRARGWIAGAFVILAAAGIYGAMRVPDDSAIERLIVADDPVALATAEFDRLFPEGDQALIMLEAPDPLSLEALRAFDTPTICNALELVAPARRAIGFTRRQLLAPFPELKPVVGFARTATIRSWIRHDSTPMARSSICPAMPAAASASPWPARIVARVASR